LGCWEAAILLQKIIVAVVAVIALSACSTTISTTTDIPAATRTNVAVKETATKIGDGVSVPADVPARLEQAVMRAATQRSGGQMPIKLAMTITRYEVVDPGVRFFAGAFAGSNKLYVAVDVIDASNGNVLGQYTVQRAANPGGYGAFYDQAQATIDGAADGVLEGLYGSAPQ
jgi:hypothetical protein